MGNFPILNGWNTLEGPKWFFHRMDTSRHNISGPDICVEVLEAVGISPSPENQPQHFELAQNYPNPFNPETVIAFKLPIKGMVRLMIYNSLGQWITTLVNRELPAGDHEAAFNAQGLTSGVYYYQIETNGFRAAKKMLLIQ